MRKHLFLVTLLTILAVPAWAFDISFDWNDPPQGSSVTGYKLYYSTESPEGPFTASGATEGSSPVDVGNSTGGELSSLANGAVYYFAVTAYNSQGAESELSNVVCNYWMPSPQFPADGATQVSRTVQLSWNAPPASGYTFTVYYGKNPSSLQSVVVPGGGKATPPRFPTVAPFLLIGLMGLLTTLLYQRRRLWLPATLLAAALAASCGGGGGGGGSSGSSEVSAPADSGSSSGGGSSSTSLSLALDANSTYYWKVVADNGQVETESEMNSFTTGG